MIVSSAPRSCPAKLFGVLSGTMVAPSLFLAVVSGTSGATSRGLRLHAAYIFQDFGVQAQVPESSIPFLAGRKPNYHGQGFKGVQQILDRSWTPTVSFAESRICAAFRSGKWVSSFFLCISPLIGFCLTPKGGGE